VAKAAIERFPAHFERAVTQGLRLKLGLLDEHEGDLALAQDLLEVMAAHRADFTLVFRRLADVAQADEAQSNEALESLRQLFGATGGIDSWIGRWRERSAHERSPTEERAAAMRLANPAFIPRNHQVEAALAAAVAGDMKPFERLRAALARPFVDQPENAALMLPPETPDPGYRTFCGT